MIPSSSDLSQGKGRTSVISGTCGPLSSQGSLRVLENTYLKAWHDALKTLCS